MRTLEQCREYFCHDLYATETTGITIDEVGEDYAVVSLDIDARHQNAAGRVMGAVYYTLCDFAFAVAANRDEQMPTMVTLSSQISFLTAPRGGRLIARAQAVREGRKVSFYEARVRDETGRLIATASCNGFRLDAGRS